MIDLYDNETNKLLGSITESELQLLLDVLEEEYINDQDYYINQATIDMIADGRASDHLLQLLRSAIGTADGVEIKWERR
ncbi:MAG: galactosyldiacylglycerol synthase [Candidatus Latescibacteria bacterium]|nr:galactosyldiacylglycerol synthase [Candidatus Latescibacterota bacterium]